MSFSDTLKTWVEDGKEAIEEAAAGQSPVKVVETPLGSNAEDAAPAASDPNVDERIARHQPPPEGTVREFADHMDRAQQAVKDWTRREIGLLIQNKSHDERVKENP